MIGEYHEPVLLKEIIDLLQLNNESKVIDCTLGDGGHTLAFLETGAYVLGIDVNEESIIRTRKRVDEVGLNLKFTAARGNFKDVWEIATKNGFEEGSIDAVLFDLGYSSFQLDEAQLGLSFLRSEPLDMRLTDDLGVTAANLVNALPQKELERLIREYGEEMHYKAMAREIVEARELKKIQTTAELAEILSEAFPGYERGRIHPATRVFQALRIAVNDELTNLKTALPEAARLLKPQTKTSAGPALPGGRMAVISFHSLEDRIVKDFGKFAQTSVNESAKLSEITKKPIMASDEEVKTNPRSRSAKLRVYERN